MVAKELLKEKESEDEGMSVLNPDYTFDTFHVDEHNRSAYEAALTVVKSPGKVYNPLSICGDPGTGKTHLLHAIAHAISQDRPELKILYTTYNEFFEQRLNAFLNINNFTMEDFRALYSGADILLFDDFHYLIADEDVKNDFFQIFETLIAAQKQVVVATIDPPFILEYIHPLFKPEMAVTIDSFLSNDP